MSAWTCDQSDNGWLKPSFDLDSSCVATEVSLGAVFAPLQATGALGRAVAIGCVEGGTSTAVYGYVDADTDLNAENVALGTALGCATGGIVQSLFGRLPARGADSLLSRGASEAVGGPKGPRRPYNTEGIRGQFFEYSCTAASCAMIGGGPEAYWREAASTVADGVTPGGTRLVDAARCPQRGWLSFHL